MVDGMAERIEETLQSYPYPVHEREGQIVGVTYGSQHRVRQPTAGQWTSRSMWPMGPGGAAWDERSTVNCCRCRPAVTSTPYSPAFCLPNEESIALHEAMGFEPLGIYREVGFKFGRWHDVGWWQRLPTADPAGAARHP